MTGAPFTHIGGAVIADHGAVTLATSRELADFYALEARLALGAKAHRWAGVCACRSAALSDAADASALWRRAAGWSDPESADAGPVP